MISAPLLTFLIPYTGSHFFVSRTTWHFPPATSQALKHLSLTSVRVLLSSSASLPGFGLFKPGVKMLWGAQASHSIRMVLVGPQLTPPLVKCSKKPKKHE